LADSTFERQAFVDIVFMVQKRLNDHGKNWRHVYKTLVVLDYFLGFASERMLKYIKEHVHLIKTLREFQYIDENGRDQGVLGNFIF
jgi:epsin